MRPMLKEHTIMCWYYARTHTFWFEAKSKYLLLESGPAIWKILQIDCVLIIENIINK